MQLSIRSATFRRWLCVLMLAILALVLSPLPAHAQAQCTITSSANSISFGTINVPRDAVVGTPFGPQVTTTGTYNCPPNRLGGGARSWYLQAFGNLAPSTTVSGAMQTNFAGIGVIIRSTDLRTSATFPLANSNIQNFASEIGVTTAVQGNYQITYQLVKTGASVGSGQVSGQMFGLRSHNVPDNVPSGYQVLMAINNTNITAQTCDVTTLTVGVELDPVTASALSPAGKTAGDKNFQLGISCPTDFGFNLFLTLTDVTNPGNTTDLLSLATGSTAQGIGLRILRRDGTSVSYGPASSVAGNRNQFEVGPSLTTTTIPLTVQYVSTSNAVTPGQVRGMATFTFSYQ
jgi:type 1 fimbria pilin